MEHQNQILQTLRAPESQARLERIVAQEALNNRAAVGRRVCAEFGFVDARGSAQLAGCLKALNTLHKAGRIALPASRRGGGAPMPQRFDAPVAAATAVPTDERSPCGGAPTIGWASRTRSPSCVCSGRFHQQAPLEIDGEILRFAALQTGGRRQDGPRLRPPAADGLRASAAHRSSI